MRFIKITFFFIASILVAVFAVNNKQLVTVSLYPLPIEFSAAIFIIFFAAFVAGALLVGGLQSFRVFYWKRVAKSAQRKLENFETEQPKNKLKLWQ